MPKSFGKVMRKNVHSLLTVSGSTLGSRVLGLFRDILVYAQLGLSQTNSAFIIAFTVPNLFRRLFGEGALSSALIPVITDENLQQGHQAGFRLLNRILTRLLVILVCLCAVFSVVVGVLLVGKGGDDSRFAEAARLGLLVFPYVIPICLAAMLAGALQVLGRFFTPAITPVLLNVSMIVFLGGPGIWFGETLFEKALWLSCGVLVGGVVQLALPAFDLYRRGWRPRLDFSMNEPLQRLQMLFLPALAGAAILQINILVSRTLAFWVGDGAVALLYLAARLVELPLGIFAIAAATVLFPEFARFFSAGDTQGLRDSYRRGSALVFAITLPAFIGLALLGGPIVGSIFAWGLFDPQDAARAVPVLAIFAAGLPFYAQATLLTRAHQARQDMKTPVRVAVWVLLANLLLSLALMAPFGVHGLAAANSLAAVLQVGLLQHRLRRNVADGQSWMPVEIWKVVIAGVGLAAFLLIIPVPGLDAGKIPMILALLWIIPGGAVLVFGLLALLRFSPATEFFPVVRERFRANRNHGENKADHD